VAGALAGLKADIVSGGLTFGAGLLTGGVLGALGAAGLARGYNLARGAGVTTLSWTDEVVVGLVAPAVLSYLAIAHYGRGRGEWSPSEYPQHWPAAVEKACASRRDALAAALGQRKDASAGERIEQAITPIISDIALDALERLYPGTPLRSDVRS
jgi:hypothetical protein